MAVTWKKLAFEADVIKHSLAAAANDFLAASGAGVFIKKTLAETLTILGKGAASGLASLNASVKVVEQPNSVTDHLEGTPTEDLATKAPTSEWAFDHDVATTGIHGVGAGTIASVSTANKDIYVDKAATGAADGTSWTDAFTTIQAAVDSMEDLIIHAYTITVRKGATPYRETVYLNSNPTVNPSHVVKGSLLIRGEYYWNGACEANVGGAGEITDTGAFADVLVGDKVFILDLNGADGRAQDYEVCTVDDISNIPNRIGTDGAKTPTTSWIYVIVRTEISGSDDGTDGGTARNYCFYINTMDKVAIQGFYPTFSDSYAVYFVNSRSSTCYYLIFGGCDVCIRVDAHSSVTASYFSAIGNDYYNLRASYNSWLNMQYFVSSSPAKYMILVMYLSSAYVAYFYLVSGLRGFDLRQNSSISGNRGTITNAVATGINAATNAVVEISLLTNNAATPVNPVGTIEGAYIA